MKPEHSSLTLLLSAFWLFSSLACSASAQPQQSEHFRVTKSVLGTGGEVSSSTNFRLVSAFGQPTPVGLSSSANFSLSAGFLSPMFQLSPLSPIQELVIMRAADDVRLWWETIPGAESYALYRSTDPLFTPGPENLLATVTDTMYIDSGAVNLPPVRHYYIVKSNNEHDAPPGLSRMGSKAKRATTKSTTK